MVISASYAPIVKFIWISLAITIHCIQEQWQTLKNVEHGWERGLLLVMV